MVPEMAENRNSARKGKAVEHLVAASCILTSGLELNVSTSFVDDEGVDLVFHRRESSTTLAVQVKSRELSAKFRAVVGASTFRQRPDLYVLFVAVDTKEGTFGPVWLVPSKVLAERTKLDGKGRHVFQASTKPDTNDRWRELRHERAELPGRIMEALDRLPS